MRELRFPGKGWATAFMILSALGFSAMQLCSSLCADIPAMEQVFFRNVMAVALYALVWKKGVRPRGTLREQPYLIGWSLCGCLNVVFLFIAAKGGDQGSLTIIGRTSGFLVVVLAAVFLKERVTATQYAAVILAIAGGAMTASPSGTLGSQPLVLTMAVLSSLFNALASLFLGLMKNRVHALTVAMHFSVLSIGLSAPFLARDFVLPDAGEWLAIAGIGLFGGLGQLTQMWAYERAPVGEVNIYGYSGILFSLALGLAFLGERPALPALAGGALVLAAGIWSYIAVGKDNPPPAGVKGGMKIDREA